MHTINVRNKYNLYWREIILSALILFVGVTSGSAQRQVEMNNPNYDKRFISYGFLIGLHTSGYQMKYADAFEALDSLHSIQPKASPGFSLGFIVNFRMTEFLDLRLLPKVSFYEHSIDYFRINDYSLINETVESTVVEFPIMLKYKSQRRGNVRMYMVGGIKPGIEASGKNDIDQSDDGLPIKEVNLSLDFGFGFDLYYPLFKFSPELRFSKGLTNMLSTPSNDLSQGIKSLNINTITLYLLFQ